jgi:hypothetical protein
VILSTYQGGKEGGRKERDLGAREAKKEACADAAITFFDFILTP